MMNVNRKNDSMKKILVWGLLAVLGIGEVCCNTIEVTDTELMC